MHARWIAFITWWNYVMQIWEADQNWETFWNNNLKMDEEAEQKKTLRDKINNVEYTRGKLLGTGGFAKCF